MSLEYPRNARMSNSSSSSGPGAAAAAAYTHTTTPTSASIVNMLPSTMMASDTNIAENSLAPVAESILSELANNTTTGAAGPKRDEDLAKIEMAVLLIIFTLTLIGNSIVILGIYFRHQKMSRMYYFILHLSIADLITAFFNVAAQFFMELTWPEFLGNDALCKFVKYAQILGPYSSSYVLVMTALDRYQAICFPLSSYRWTTKRSKIMLAFAWATALAFCVPQLFIFSLIEVPGYPGVHDCYATFTENWGAKSYVTWYSISFFIIPLILLIFAYTCICRTLWLNASMKTLIGKVEYKNGNGGGSPHKGAGARQDRNLHSRMSQDSTSSDEIIRQAINKQLKKKPSEKRLLMKFRSKNIQKNVKNSSLLLRVEDEKEQNELLHGLESRVEANGNVRSLLTSTSTTSTSPGSIRPQHGVRHECSTTSTSEGRHTSQSDFGDDEATVGDLGLEGKLVEEELKEILKGSEKYYGKNEKGNEMKCLLSYKSKFPNEVVIQSNGQGIRGKLNGQLETSSSSATAAAEVAVRVGSDGVVTVNQQPRTHSTTGISRAKIKTIKLTITVIACYIVCSSPFIAAQLWACYDPHAEDSPFYTGATFTILVLLASLNSCVNPWIFLFFNPNLLEDFIGGLTRKNLRNLRRQKSKTSANATLRTWAGGGSRRMQASPLPETVQQNSIKKLQQF